MRMSKQKLATMIVGILLLAGVIAFLLSGDNLAVLKSFFRPGITRDEIRETAQDFGWKGAVSLMLLSMLQVVLMFLPAEPVQVIAGISCGLWQGALICCAGVALGNCVIYVLYRVFGRRLSEYFAVNVDLDLDSAHAARGISLIVLLLYVLPAIPYGMICFFAASTGMKFHRYLLLTMFGSVPSILIGVGLGHLAITASLIWALVIFVALVAVLLVLVRHRKKCFALLNDYIRRRTAPFSATTAVRRQSTFFTLLLAGALRLYTALMYRCHYTSDVKRLDKPSIVICNHGSFVDFLFAARLLWRERPHFIVARMYFFHRWLAFLLRHAGAFPKSMYTPDLENAKNCLRVLKQNGCLAMMPEARLSAAGEFEGIQQTTLEFLYKAGVSIYLLKLEGDYLANPKWSPRARRRATVDVHLSKLFDAQEVAAMPFEAFSERVTQAISYNDFEWLKAHPRLRYRQKDLAEGLEGILYLCPRCRSVCALTSKGRTLTCRQCGMQAQMNDRYGFEDAQPFDNLQEWFRFQVREMEQAVASDPNFHLSTHVVLKHASLDGKTILRVAGEGECRLDKNGLVYTGTEDGKQVEVVFSPKEIYRLLFGAGEDFEIYRRTELYYFVPTDPNSSVMWYVASYALRDYFRT